MKKLTKEEVLESFKEKHGNYFTYPEFEYQNTKQVLIIACPVHGEFSQSIKEHKSGKGCQRCSAIKSNNRTRKTTKSFIEESIKIHGSKYDYSLVDYKRRDEKVIIICSKHGEFKQKPYSHLRGIGCPICGRGKSDLSTRKTTEQFIEESISVHGDMYDYSKLKYVLAKEKVDILCKTHGVFFQRPYDHLNGHGCPVCNESRGEAKIRKWLKNEGIDFISQKTFDECRGTKRPLPFDFYLPEYNLLIEYDGIQHYESVEYFGGEEYFTKIIKYDKTKDEYCRDNKINILRICYLDFYRIEEVICKSLSDLKEIDSVRCR